MRNAIYLLAALLWAACAAGAHAQSASGDNSLAGTMQFIETSLRSLPPFTYVETVEMTSGKIEKTTFTVSYSDVHADPATCQLRWTHKNQLQRTYSLYEWVFDLRPTLAYRAQLEAPAPDPSTGEKTKANSPNVYNLLIVSAVANVQRRNTSYNNDGSVSRPPESQTRKGAYLELADLNFAQKLGAAISRANKLCNATANP